MTDNKTGELEKAISRLLREISMKGKSVQAIGSDPGFFEHMAVRFPATMVAVTKA